MSTGQQTATEHDLVVDLRSTDAQAAGESLRDVHADMAQHLLDLERTLDRRSDPRIVALAKERRTEGRADS